MRRPCHLAVFINSFQPASWLFSSLRPTEALYLLPETVGDLNVMDLLPGYFPTVPDSRGGASAIMPVDEFWLCLPASHVRPFMQMVRVTCSYPRCFCFPMVLPSISNPSCVPAISTRDSPIAPLPPPSSFTASPSASQTSSSADPPLPPPACDCRQEKIVQPGMVSVGLFD